jgi:hypothetical protein
MNWIASRRLTTQRLVGEPLESVVDAVGWLGAVQSQDYPGAKWGLGQRSRGATDAEVDRLFDEGAILRTHVLRPTWHFVLPVDIRWMLELTAPRVKSRMALYDRRLEIDEELMKRSRAVIETSLLDGANMTRRELRVALEQAGIPTDNSRLANLLMHAELDAIVTSGAHRGRQMTYALLELRAPTAIRLDSDAALAELTRRYFTSHGPAQVQDFAWWSGLTMRDTRRGLEMAGSALVHEVIDGKSYWTSPDERRATGLGPVAHLLPDFDEYLVAYRDRSAALERADRFRQAPLPPGDALMLGLTVNGQVLGGWKLLNQGRRVILELRLLGRLDEQETLAVREGAAGLERFVGLSVEISGL